VPSLESRQGGVYRAKRVVLQPLIAPIVA